MAGLLRIEAQNLRTEARPYFQCRLYVDGAHERSGFGPNESEALDDLLDALINRGESGLAFEVMMLLADTDHVLARMAQDG